MFGSNLFRCAGEVGDYENDENDDVDEDAVREKRDQAESHQSCLSLIVCVSPFAIDHTSARQSPSSSLFSTQLSHSRLASQRPLLSALRTKGRLRQSLTSPFASFLDPRYPRRLWKVDQSPFQKLLLAGSSDTKVSVEQSERSLRHSRSVRLTDLVSHSAFCPLLLLDSNLQARSHSAAKGID